MIAFLDVEAGALAAGAVAAAFVERGTVTEGDELELVASSSAGPGEVQPRYLGFAETAPAAGVFTAVVESVHPAGLLDPVSGGECHVWTRPGAGDLVVLRVYGPEGPVVDDHRFAEMRRAAEGALRQ